MRATILALVAILCCAACGPAPATPAPPAAATPPPQAPQIPPLIPRMGNHRHPIVTTSGEAQLYFDQGFNFVFGFNHEEAVRSFRRAAELDPNAPMPHWGIAWALGPN